MADAMDSKSIVREGVRVQVPPPAPKRWVFCFIGMLYSAYPGLAIYLGLSFAICNGRPMTTLSSPHPHSPHSLAEDM